MTEKDRVKGLLIVLAICLLALNHIIESDSSLESDLNQFSQEK